jgi:hypothetical protein
MILSVEAIIEEDKTISFEKAVIKAKVEGFGKYSFREIEEERVALINKKQRKEYGIHLKTYFTLPYLAFTILIFSSSYLALNFFEKPYIMALVFLPIIFCLIDWSKKQLKYSKKNNLKILKMQNYGYLVNLVTLWSNLFNAVGIIGVQNLSSSVAYKIFASIIITMSFLSFLFYVKLSKKVTEEIQQQIFV